MNIIQMYEKVKAIFEANEDKYTFVGLRFEDRDLEVGVECDWSKSNHDREDEREFPDFDSEEYEEMESMGGTSAWNMASPAIYKIDRGTDLEKPCDQHFSTWHCYVIAGNRKSHKDMPLDDNEIVIADAVVIAKIF
ncbi:hypothetical protein ACIFQM_00810 [Paenibacillus sp. NRS-1782]|uniref:hypothetical protein n=1 Tax=Paenibacillus sp. NRS-1782 TaxID=3233906 RepID=UPI003D2901E6